MIFPVKRTLRKIALLLSAVVSFVTMGYAQQNGTDNTIRSIERNSIDNSPASITFTDDAGWKAGQFKQIFSRYLAITDNDVEMKLVTATTTPAKITTERYAEYYKGLKVAHGGYTLTIKDGLVRYMTGNYYALADKPSALPVITESSALANALQYVGAERYKWQDSAEEQHIRNLYHRNDTSYFPKGQLVWVEDMLGERNDRKLHLAYSFNIYAIQPLTRQEVFVDAQSGKILFSNEQIRHTAASGKTLYSGVVPFQTAHVGASYRLYDSTRGNGVHTLSMHNTTNYTTATEITSATNIFPVLAADTTALDAHWGAEKVYDYWLSQQGRHSWDDLDGILIQYVHYSTNYDNAYWDGVEMTYGDGSGVASGGFSSLTSIDVTAHEIGHGVCQATANLVYNKESGAMNEGFSDCWAATIENWANPYEVDAMPKKPWDIGEEISTEPLRSMNSPLLQGQPDTYGSTNWVTITGCTPSGGNDQCGVHTNSGLLNYWYYLLTMGGSGTNGIGNSYVVNPLGWTKSGTVLYQTELVLASTATYADCRIASINAATLLYGACSPEVQCVTSAWYAVGVGADFVPCTPQLGFVAPTLHVTEKAPGTACPVSKVVTISMKPYGPTITGGSPIANILVAPTSTAVAGVDYSLSTTAVTFPVGSTATQNITLTIYDNGAVNDNKHIDLGFTVTTAGSTAVVSPTHDSMIIYIDNDDSIPQAGGIQYHTLNAGTPVTCDVSSSFLGKSRRAHSQFLLYANELQAAGVIPGAPISQIAFNVLTKSSTAPFVGYTVSMKNTAVANLGSAFVTGLTQVFTGNHTTNLGMDSLDFNTSTFTWDGVSNVAVELCFGMTPAAFAANDKVAGVQQDAFTIGDYNTSNTGAGTGCSLGFNTGNLSTARPVMRFKQTVPPAGIETVIASTRTWDVHAGQEVYFYNPSNSNVIAGIKSVTNDLGCVTAVVSQQGVGFAPASFSPINRSRKEITVTPTINGAITSYDMTMYLTNTELAGVAAGTLFLLKTDAPTDATVSTANSVLVTPSLVTGTSYVGFRGSFTGFSRFMLVDGPLCNTTPAAITAAGPTHFCLGGNVTLNANTGAGLTYQWQLGGANISGATDASFVAATEGNYNVIVYQNVCDSVSLPVFVNVDSPSVAAITGTPSVCTGQTITLADATAGGVWSSGNPGLATVGSSSGVVTGAAAGTVTISYTVTNLCGSNSSTLSVTVSAPATVAAITGTASVCVGATTTLGDITGSGTWSSALPGTAAVGTSGVVTGMGAGTAVISYSVTNVSGCVTAAVRVVTVNALPVATITPSGPTTFCTGGFVVLNATAGAGLSYQWKVSGGVIPGATSASYTASTGGSYTVVVTNANGCAVTSSPVTVTVNSSTIVVPAVTISVLPGTTLCSATTVATFTATPANGGSAPTYQWSVNGSPMATGSTFNYTPASGDNVSCVLTSNATCAFPLTASNSVLMSISGMLAPAVSIDPSPNDTVCTGDLVTLAAVPVNGGTHPTYLWTENGVNVATGPYYLYTPLDGDLLICTMTSNFPCLSTPMAVSPTLVLHVQAPSANTISVSVSPTSIAPGQTATFTAVATNGGPSPVYTWFINGVPVPGATGPVYTTDSLRNGQIVNCSLTSSVICAEPHTIVSAGLTVAVATGIAETAAGGVFTLSPNPNKGTFTVRGSIAAYAGDQLDIMVTDMLGQVVFSRASAVQGGTINEQVVLPAIIAQGMYLVHFALGGSHQVFHMVVAQ